MRELSECFYTHHWQPHVRSRLKFQVEWQYWLLHVRNNKSRLRIHDNASMFTDAIVFVYLLLCRSVKQRGSLNKSSKSRWLIERRWSKDILSRLFPLIRLQVNEWRSFWINDSSMWLRCTQPHNTNNLVVQKKICSSVDQNRSYVQIDATWMRENSGVPFTDSV